MSINTFLNSLTIKVRLLIAVSALALSTIIIGISSWYWLARSNSILEDLHNTTLHEVNRSHDLTKRSSFFTTSAPYLLNLRSSYLVESEGNKLLSSIDDAIASWEKRDVKGGAGGYDSADILRTLGEMRVLMSSLINRITTLSDQDDSTRGHTAKLVEIDKKLESVLSDEMTSDQIDVTRQVQKAVSQLITASHATSLLSLGEYRRRFLKIIDINSLASSPDIVQNAMADVISISKGSTGLFQTRFTVLQENILARRLLTNLSAKSSELNVEILTLIQSSESEIARRREETTSNIQYAKILVALFGLGSIALSMVSAFYISGYIIKRLNMITTTMTGLARGDLSLGFTGGAERQDELGALQNAFNVFHANALKHDKLNAELIQKSALFESTFNNINDGVAITNAEGALLAFNPKLNQLLGHFGSKSAASIGCNLSERVVEVATKAGESQRPQDNALYKELRNSLGHVLEIRTSELPDGGFVWLFSDTTERRRVEERLQHFHRLESLGQLTGEVAHDVNNVLSAVKITLSSVVSKRLDEVPHRLAVEKIEDAVDIGNSLTQRLLAFAKKQRLDPKNVDVNELVTGVSELISLSLSDQIDLSIRCSEKTLSIYIDPLQLESALLNLCMNSAHAISGKGQIEIKIERSIDNMLTIIVKDDGCGMSSETVNRAIEPFFSTRRGSSGTGLGLSIVYGFVKQSGGDMNIKSQIGAGTTVELAFPLTSTKSASNHLIAPSGGSKTVLIVEDDSDTGEWAVELFQSVGYHATRAQSFREASDILQNQTKFTLLFTDLHLGVGGSGWDLATLCLRNEYVEQVIVTSGRLLELSSMPRDLAGNCKTLEKPYSMHDISSAISY